MVLRFRLACALLEYWQATSEPKMPVIRFEGRGCDKSSFNDEKQSTGNTTKKNIVLFLSDIAYIDTTGEKSTILRLQSPKGGWSWVKGLLQIGKAVMPMLRKFHSYSSPMRFLDEDRREANL